MDSESQHVKYLIIVAAMLCAVIIGYNAFYVPNADMSEISINTDTSSLSTSGSGNDEEYMPSWPSSGNDEFTFSSAESKLSISSTNGAAKSKSSKADSAGKILNGKVNINTASASEISSLKGIGNALAKRVVEYREKNGKFKTIDDIKKVSGIGDKKFENIKGYITV